MRLAAPRERSDRTYQQALCHIEGRCVGRSAGPGGQLVTALVTNTGVIRADGGTVQLTAREADGLVQDLVRAGGKISTDSVGSKTGTVVLGGNVTIGLCAILHGNLSIEVTTELQVSQPGPFSNGTTQVVPQTQVRAQESPLQVVQLKEGATVEELVRGLQMIGASARDVVAILQAIKAAGALNADLEVL